MNPIRSLTPVTYISRPATAGPWVQSLDPVVHAAGPPNASSPLHRSEPGVPSGLAHVATVSFLASRASPTAGFWIALAGGVALARAGAERGARVGYGASLAAMLETVAIMGPPRFGVPLTQALTAPLLGTLEARGATLARLIFACAAIRLIQNALFVCFFIFVLAGGLDAYTGSYDSIARLLFLPEGTSSALILTAAGLLAWAAFGSTVQVLVYRRGLRGWPAARADVGAAGANEPAPHVQRRFDPRAVAVAAVVAFVLLLASTAWVLLAAVAGWLALAWLTSRPDGTVTPVGIVLAGVLGAGVLAFTLVGGVGFTHALRRATRAALLVLVATWLRAAAGSTGLREVSQRTLARLRRVPSVPEAARMLDELGSERRIGAAASSVAASLRDVRRRPIPVLDAVLGWVAVEARRFRPAAAAMPAELRARARDVALVGLAVAPLLTLVT
jgi:hypothetical protein